MIFGATIVVFVVLFVVVLVVLSVIWLVQTQNRLVYSEELCQNALSQIGVQQSSRWDALSALVDLTKNYSEHEYRVLIKAITTRKSVGPETPINEAQEQENMLKNSFGRIFALAEAYPDLKSNTVYIKTMESVRELEGQVRMSRMVYNDTVTKYNRLVRAFPTSLVVIMFDFRVRYYLQTDSGKAEMPSMISPESF